MHHLLIAKRLSHPQVAKLLEHIVRGEVRSVPIIRIARPRHSNQGYHNTLEGLTAARLLRYDRQNKPRSTSLTEDGRMVVACLFGMYADALTTIGVSLSPVTNGEWRTALARVQADYSSHDSSRTPEHRSKPA